jgi:hypothetical protein
MSIAHQTHHPDSQITDIIALRDPDDHCMLVAIAQGTTMHLMDPHQFNYPIVESYPFRSPIITIASFSDSNLFVFVLLRNYDFFIFRIPELIRFGSLASPISCPPQRSIFRRSSFLSPALAGSNPIATAAIRFAESRVCWASHPKFIALHISGDVIHVLSLKSDQIIAVPVREPNIVDMRFLGPTSTCCRLVYLADWKSGRRLRFLTLTGDQSAFAEEPPGPCDVPEDAHSLLPLRERSEGSLIVFTRTGIIRIKAPQGAPRTEDRVLVFLPFDGVILRSCRLSDDVHLICDSSGGLTAGLFPPEGRPRTEFLQNVGPAAAIVALDSSHFIVGTPFGDSMVYECNRLDDHFSIAEVKRIPGSGPIASLSLTNNGMLCAAGRGDTGSLRLFGDSLSCTKIAEIPVSNCFNFFAASIGGLLYLCLCFWDRAHVATFA